jgi:hypothetical protein
MPATIIGNSEWTSRGLVLTAQNAQEQVNGLVNVQVTYVGPASRHDQISRSFYLDAPPPIWPDVVSRNELVTNRLYMVSRSVSRANGLTTVQADYVGGLQRSGFKGYFLQIQKEIGQTGLAYLVQNPDGSVTTSVSFGALPAGAAPIPSGLNASPTKIFGYDLTIQMAEFVMVGNATAVALPSFVRNDLISVVSSSNQQFDILNYTAEQIFAAPLLQLRNGSYFRDTPCRVQETIANYVTPTVKIMRREYSL